MNKYCLHDNYKDNTYTFFDDSPYLDQYQDEVYKYIRSLVPDKATVVDIGCGSGFKLMKYFKECKTIGHEVEPTLSFLKNKYPHRLWTQSDFSTPLLEDIDCMMSIDCIEHLTDPDQLLEFFRKSNTKLICISTPSRWENPQGPPSNGYHVREWNTGEFADYIHSKGFKIKEHKIFGNTQLVIIDEEGKG